MTADEAIGAAKRQLVLPYRVVVAGLAALVVILLVASLAIGYMPLDLWQGARDIWHGELTPTALVILELRVPRALLGCLVGFSLGLTGAALQGLLRNPLAEPGIIGISRTAALGAVAGFYFRLAGGVSLRPPTRCVRRSDTP